ncbi:50S ribosomal protein L35 [Zavarzinia sp. CC-PAN008]|uniref:50S ribosomal protein L35 n=1 Tax=Zavarzinia sp. CC-PAN008 TaxID=3243332 RepID=UPI003F743FA5
MPKMKTHSGAKKRFSLTASGRVKSLQAGKRHGMLKRSNKFIRNQRGSMILFKADGENVKKFFLPND